MKRANTAPPPASLMTPRVPEPPSEETTARERGQERRGRQAKARVGLGTRRHNDKVRGSTRKHSDFEESTFGQEQYQTPCDRGRSESPGLP